LLLVLSSASSLLVRALCLPLFTSSCRCVHKEPDVCENEIPSFKTQTSRLQCFENYNFCISHTYHMYTTFPCPFLAKSHPCLFTLLLS